MYNDFIIIGPEGDSAGIKGSNNGVESLGKIKEKKSLFISRGDNSGTHKKELEIWKKAGVDVKKLEKYLEVGQGMNQTIRIADEKDAYCTTDRASYLYNKDMLRLVLLVEKDSVLLNPYGVIAVSPYKHPHVNYKLSMALICWLTSPECQKMIESYRKDGNIMFYPNAAIK